MAALVTVLSSSCSLPLAASFVRKPHSARSLGCRKPCFLVRFGRIEGSPKNAFLFWKASSKVLLVFNKADSSRAKSTKGMMSQLELEETNMLSRRSHPVNAVYWILLLNLGLFIGEQFSLLHGIRGLYLYHDGPCWYQFITATFCHVNWNHLSSNLFFLYIFGKLVEEEEGSLALWASYIITGAGANLISWLILPRMVVSAGASGAVFGLFAISVLVKISWDWRKILEVLILGQFVIAKVMEAAQASVQMTGFANCSISSINHVAHLSGAFVGAALIWLVSHIPMVEKGSEQSRKRT